MLQQIEGSAAVAKAVALCRPEVIAAYPITPQTHIVEGLGEMVKRGDVGTCQFMNVESEFGAMSTCIGSSAEHSGTLRFTTAPIPPVRCTASSGFRGTPAESRA